MRIADPLKRLPQIQSEINALKKEFFRILDNLRSGVESTVLAAAASVRRGRRRRAAAKVAAKGPVRRRPRSPLKGKKRPASPSGPLAPAVVKVLKSRGKPSNVNAVLDGLKKNKYVFTA